MKVTGIIAEYNPFHKGHQYHIKTSRERTGADYIIVVMSGNFTQRGDAAITDKYQRARYALENGVDLVLELPACFATASAGYFACGGVSLLEQLGVVDFLSFGSEAGTIDSFPEPARLLLEEPPIYRDRLQTFLKQGCSYPKARMEALSGLLPDFSRDTLTLPNNILGIEYCLALLTLKSGIKPVTVPRIHNDYHDEALSETGYSSATSIRRILGNGGSEDDFLPLQAQLPQSVYRQIRQEYGRTLPVFLNDFSSLLHYRLLTTTREELATYSDLHSDLADRIYHHRWDFSDLEAFCDLLKTKELTRSRISRSLLHLLLEIKEEHMQEYKASYSSYARILGFRKDAGPLLHAIKANGRIPLISKLADAARQLDPLSLRMLETDIRSAHIYESIACRKFGRSFQNELTRQFPIINT